MSERTLIPLISVGELNHYVKGLLDRDMILSDIRIRGEVSNFTRHASGHLYFSLKDHEARIRCVMFRSEAMGLDFFPAEGTGIIASGRVTLYEREGVYQLYVRSMEEEGKGALFQAFLKLKERLEKEGLFAEECKTPIPSFPKKIAILTSPVGAAVRDIIHVARRRSPSVSLVVAPVPVQGEGAAKVIADMLDTVNEREDIDLIIVGRGGGSIEDLWAFNEEVLARAIARSRIPVVSAVGHETDFTIADFVSDLRAPTPSAAAELAVPDSAAWLAGIEKLRRRMAGQLQWILEDAAGRLTDIKARPVLSDPDLWLNEYRERLSDGIRRAGEGMDDMLSDREHAHQAMMRALGALNPLAVLTRGYAAVTDQKTDAPVYHVKDMEIHQDIRLRMQDGQADCKVYGIMEGDG
mgnify:CR=1 FL=1